MAVGLITMDMCAPCSRCRRNTWHGDTAERQTRKIAPSKSPASVMVHDQGGPILSNDNFDDAAGSSG